MAIHEDGVKLSVLVTTADGGTAFEDRLVPYVGSQGGIRYTAPVPARCINFRAAPATFGMDFHPAPRNRLIAVTHGGIEIETTGGETRICRPGDLVEVRDIHGTGHRSRAWQGQPARHANIELDDDVVTDRTRPLDGPPTTFLDYVHNLERADGTSYFERRRLAYSRFAGGGLQTDDIPLKAVQFTFAPGDLDYDFHPAPQRQIVLVLDGAIAMEYGDGSRHTVSAGDFIIGEDWQGRGHASRAVDGRPRFSIFAHLA